MKGSTVEAWRNDGSAGRGSGSTTDSTYAGAATSASACAARPAALDDFGARTIGVAPATAPSAPQSLPATAGNAQVSLTWSAPSSNGGSALTGVHAVPLDDARAPEAPPQSPSPGVATSYIDTTAMNGTAYYYKVKAMKRSASQLASNEASATPSAPATAPSAPQNLPATAGNAQVTLTWTRTSSNGGSALTGVHACTARPAPGNPRRRLRSPRPGVARATSTRASRTAPTYYYKVKATNAIGESAASNEANATPSAPATAPSAPQNLQATAGNAPGLAHLERACLERRLGAHRRTSVYRSTSSGQPEAPPALASPGVATSYIDTDRQNGTDLLLQGEGHER